MNPSRELDALIAETVFGLFENVSDWRKHEELKTNSNPDVFNIYHVNYYRMCMKYPSEYGEIKFFSKYSTDIAAAWFVVDEVTKRLKKKDNKWYPVIHSLNNKWECGWSTSYLDCADFVADGESAPHAICLAALKSLTP